jgi:hypothetical protein
MAAKTMPTMARVVRRSAPASPVVSASALLVEVGESRIVVRRGFDAELLREVVAALGASR